MPIYLMLHRYHFACTGISPATCVLCLLARDLWLDIYCVLYCFEAWCVGAGGSPGSAPPHAHLVRYLLCVLYCVCAGGAPGGAPPHAPLVRYLLCVLYCVGAGGSPGGAPPHAEHHHRGQVQRSLLRCQGTIHDINYYFVIQCCGSKYIEFGSGF